MNVTKLLELNANGPSREISVQKDYVGTIGVEIRQEILSSAALIAFEGQVHGEGAWFPVLSTNILTGVVDTISRDSDLDSDRVTAWFVPTVGLYAFRVSISGVVDSDLDSDDGVINVFALH